MIRQFQRYKTHTHRVVGDGKREKGGRQRQRHREKVRNTESESQREIETESEAERQKVRERQRDRNRDVGGGWKEKARLDVRWAIKEAQQNSMQGAS